MELMKSLLSSKEQGNYKLISSGSRHMDENLWSQLPEDLINSILARLGIPDLFQARLVCKKWDAVIRSPAFLKASSELPARLPWYLGFQGFRHEQGWAYDPGTGTWYNLDFSFLPLGRCAAAAGGLLCFCQDNVQGNSLYICNPMTKSWRALPPFPGSIKQVFMSVDNSADKYVVIVFGSGWALVFDKQVGRWREISGLVAHPWINIVDAVFCGDVLYCLNKCSTHDWQFIKAYDLRRDIYSDVRIPMPNEFSNGALMQMTYLVEHAGKLLLVEKTISSPDILTSGTAAIKASVGIHELDTVDREWRNVGSLANTTLCIGSFTSRAIRSNASEKLVYFTNHGSAVNLYNVDKGTWHRLSEFPREKMITTWMFRKPRCNLGVVIPSKGLWFEPRLDCSV